MNKLSINLTSSSVFDWLAVLTSPSEKCTNLVFKVMSVWRGGKPSSLDSWRSLSLRLNHWLCPVWMPPSHYVKHNDITTIAMATHIQPYIQWDVSLTRTDSNSTRCSVTNHSIKSHSQVMFKLTVKKQGLMHSCFKPKRKCKWEDFHWIMSKNADLLLTASELFALLVIF